MQELDGQYIFRLEPKPKALTAVVCDTEKPNGIAISADSGTLFFTDNTEKHIFSASIQKNGSVGERQIFASSEKFKLRDFFGHRLDRRPGRHCTLKNRATSTLPDAVLGI